MKVTTRIRFLDSNSKEVISRKLRDACKVVIDSYNLKETVEAPILRIVKTKDNSFDVVVSEEVKGTKNINLLDYSEEDGKLKFSKLLKEVHDFVSIKDEEEQEVEVSEEEITNAVKESKEENTVKEEQTYRQYLEEHLSILNKSNFRYYLISILLGKDKGWSYLKDPSSIEGDDYDVVTPKNAKKILKIFKESHN